MSRLKDIWMTGSRNGQADLEPIAIVDIGSNSVRLVVYEGAIRAPTPLFNEKILCGLGRSVATTGSLGDEAVDRALAALTRFRAIARVLRVKSIFAIATAAVRDAKNGKSFIARGEKALGCAIEILSGEKEARLAAQGIMMGIVDADGIAGDLGGGSLELIDVERDKLNEAATLPLGGLRLIDVTGNKLDKAVAIIDDAITSLPWVKQGTGRTFFAVGGTWRALAKMHMDGAKYPLRVMHGYRLPAREALAFAETVRKSKKVGELPGILHVARARREVVPYGALVLERLLRYMQPRHVMFSVYGIREGLIYGVLPPHERRRDPLISFCEAHAALHSRSLKYARELVKWTAQVFVDDDLIETAEEQRLRHAACLLSDIGWRAHPDYRGEHSLNKVAQAGLGGIDHTGRIFLALAVFYRHDTSEDMADPFAEQLRQLLSKRQQRRARIIGAAIRTANLLSVSMPGVIDETTLTLDANKLLLTIPKAHEGLNGERLRRRLEGLAALLGRKADVRISR